MAGEGGLGSKSNITFENVMSAAQQAKELNQQNFDRLLNWLDPDRERAGVLYEKIRWRLVAILAARGCAVPEELADETINRVARRVLEIEAGYVGDKALYFLGVMNNVHHEYLKRPPLPRLVEQSEPAERQETIHLCLDRCLDKLAPFSRQLIERYYAENRRAKIDLRKLIARDLGISAGTLRLRALRIRQTLQTCIEDCLKTSEAN